MWSLASSHEQWTGAHKKIRSSVKKDFFNTIDPKQNIALALIAQSRTSFPNICPSRYHAGCKLFHVIGPPFVIAAVKHVWHATGREGADRHPFPSSAHV